MNSISKSVISASRRTDIPAFYMEWFMTQISHGFFNVTNPVNRKAKRVPADSAHVHSIVFWSKNFTPFIESRAGSLLEKMGYHLYFNFTVNSSNPLLEPNVPSLKNRINQLDALCSLFGPDRITWRFDPVCFYRMDHRTVETNLNDFDYIADCVGQMGIKNCVTSFVDIYLKIKKRLAFLAQKERKIPELFDPDMSKKIETIAHMYRVLCSKNIALALCCEHSVFGQLPPGMAVRENACIDGARLKQLFSGHPVLKRDYGQRSRLGCRCTQSVDIGSYEDHPCFHDCVFCYASPAMDRKVQVLS